MLTTKHQTITTTNETTLFTVPAGYVANIYYIFIANHGGSANTVTLKWENSAGVDQLFFFDGDSINGGNKETLGGQSSIPLFVIQAGEVVKCQTGSAGDVEFLVTFNLEERVSPFNDFD
jgi:hypothetical protein